MTRSLVFVALGLIALGGALVALDVVPLFSSDPAGDERADGETDLLDAEGERAVGTLQGRGVEPAADARAGGLQTAEAAEGALAEVRGTTPGGGIVRGRVVRAQGRVPMPGVRVSLGRPDSIIAYLRAKANGRYDELEARSGADGRFVFLDVTPSKGYVVRARHPDYAVSSAKGTIDLNARGTEDVGDLELGAGGALAGRVLDPAERPVAGVRVAATWRIANPLGVILSDPDTAPELERETLTDAQGRFRIERLGPGPKTVFAAAPSGAQAVVRSVSVEEGTTTTVDDIALPGPGFLAGRVVWADGKPIAGARVFAANQSRRQDATRSAETDADGRFRLDWLPEGKGYGIGVFVPGLPVRIDWDVVLGRDDLLVEFPRPGVLEGRVVQAAGGRPVPRFCVQLDTIQTGEKGFDMNAFLQQQIQSGLGPAPFEDASGSFRLARVAAGDYVVTVASPGYPDVKHAAVTITPGETTTISIEVPDGHVGRGRVLRADGTPIGQATLHVIPRGVKEGAQGVQLTGYVNQREPDAATDALGAFELPPQTPGIYDVIAAHADTLPAVLRRVDLRRGDANDLELRLPPSGAVRGRLLDEHARPATDEQIFILYADGVVRLEDVDDEGRFFVKGLPVGRCLVRWLSMRDAAQHARAIQRGNEEEKRRAYDALRLEGGEQEVTDGGVIEVTLRLPRRVRVSGRVQVPGQPERTVEEIWVNMPGAPNWVRIECDREGRFARELEAGAYRAYVPLDDGKWGLVEFEIPDVPAFQVDFPRR